MKSKPDRHEKAKKVAEWVRIENQSNRLLIQSKMNEMVGKPPPDAMMIKIEIEFAQWKMDEQLNKGK